MARFRRGTDTRHPWVARVKRAMTVVVEVFHLI
jgi:hypothetical protein